MRCVAVIDAGSNYSLIYEHFESIGAAREYFRTMLEESRLPGERIGLVEADEWRGSPRMLLYDPYCWIEELELVDGYPFREFSRGPRGGLVEVAT